MKIFRLHLLIAVGFVLIGLPGVSASTARAADAPRMSIEDLRDRLGEPGLMLIDVRRGGDWNNSSAKIKSAVRHDPAAFAQWKSEVPKDATIVLYCA